WQLAQQTTGVLSQAAESAHQLNRRPILVTHSQVGVWFVGRNLIHIRISVIGNNIHARVNELLVVAHANDEISHGWLTVMAGSLQFVAVVNWSEPAAEMM